MHWWDYIFGTCFQIGLQFFAGSRRRTNEVSNIQQSPHLLWKATSSSQGIVSSRTWLEAAGSACLQRGMVGRWLLFSTATTKLPGGMDWNGARSGCFQLVGDIKTPLVLASAVASKTSFSWNNCQLLVITNFSCQVPVNTSVNETDFECPFKCPELDACIGPSLWCDGKDHCPSGWDESESQCGASSRLLFTLPGAALAAAAAVAASIVLLLCLALNRLRVRRRRRLAKKKLLTGPRLLDSGFNSWHKTPPVEFIHVDRETTVWGRVCPGPSVPMLTYYYLPVPFREERVAGRPTRVCSWSMDCLQGKFGYEKWSCVVDTLLICWVTRTKVSKGLLLQTMDYFVQILIPKKNRNHVDCCYIIFLFI